MGEHLIDKAGILSCPDKGGRYPGKDYPDSIKAGRCPACGAPVKWPKPQ